MHTFNIPHNTADVRAISLTYSQKDEIVVKKKLEDCILNEQKIKCKLTQEDTLKFDYKNIIETQLRYLTNDGESHASKTFTMMCGKCLDKEVLK